jgi:hypothetical protein
MSGSAPFKTVSKSLPVTSRLADDSTRTSSFASHKPVCDRVPFVISRLTDPIGSGTAAAAIAIAVLPLANFSRDPRQEYFAGGMSEALINDLSKIGALKVISRHLSDAVQALRLRARQASAHEIADLAASLRECVCCPPAATPSQEPKHPRRSAPQKVPLFPATGVDFSALLSHPSAAMQATVLCARWLVDRCASMSSATPSIPSKRHRDEEHLCW